MQLSLQNFSTLVEGMAASVQGAAQALLDLTAGSVLRAILEANASVGLWLQWLILQVLSATRLATSVGADCDSFGQDFGFTRLPGVAAVGVVTFSRFTPSVAAFIPVGCAVAVAGGQGGFTVTADATNPAYVAPAAGATGGAIGGYNIAATVAALSVPVAASFTGAAGNVMAGAISLITTALPGVDTVTNNAVLAGGMDAESDAAFKARFGNYLAGLAKATPTAVGSAVAAVQQGLSFEISENINQAGSPQAGHFVVTLDDGSGMPPAGLLNTVWQAVDAVRPVGSSFAVQGPVVLAANIAMTITTNAGVPHQPVVAAVAGAIETYIAGLGVGAVLPYTRLAQLAYGASSAVNNVANISLNNGMADLVPPLFGVIRAGTVAVA